MDTHFKFLTLPHGNGTVANVFIHGYSAGHDLRDRRSLSRSIPTTFQDGLNIFGFWPSGHILEMDWETVKSMAGGLGNTAQGVMGFVSDRVRHFTRSRLRAETMGHALLAELDSYLIKHHPYVASVNLVGHSLGGRVVVSALRKMALQPGSFDLPIRDVLLMAAAVEVSAKEALQLKSQIKGTLYNAWSANDKTLRMCIDEACLGRKAVEHFENVSMDGFGHTDYWPKLHEVLTKSGFAGFKGQQYPAPLGQADASGADPVRDDYLLHDVIELSPPKVLDEAIKHLQTSSWARLDHQDRLYGFTREFQLVAGHCLANLARRRGLQYADALEMLVSHFDLSKALHDCASVLEVEAALVRKFFEHSFPEGHPLCTDTLTVVKGLSADEYFQQVDVLAERLTLASYVKKTPATKDSGQAVAAVSAAQVAERAASTFGRVVTNLLTALKPGYSALIPTVAIIFHARVKLSKQYLNN
ncbi:DUF726 domain-containing protein [Pseudomonas sp. Teo4]|uniref:DUF726 domain-containing protein n=1 Tax=Pseudomonas sp. Teo4 TaxID=3064528 RepID=UPI002AB83911|nr:DUF726 domain-containing protein [Pseudomonas sp. Teo4]MDZ3993775.1 hypothetical protein [Pseudomonas sp. Teo4]